MAPDHLAARISADQKAQQARENRAYVRMLLWQRQPAFAAALSSAELSFGCLVNSSSCAAGPDVPQETSGGGAGRGEQAEGAGSRDYLGAAVRAQLAAHVADVRADRGYRYRQLAGDLWGRQVGRQGPQHSDLTSVELLQ
jgi:hypothetical protein